MRWKNIRCVLLHRAIWSEAKKKKIGQTQCRTCGMFTHGSQSWHRRPVCFKCAQQHLTEHCSIDFSPQPTAGSSSSEVPPPPAAQPFVCINCIQRGRRGQAILHTAYDPECPAKLARIASLTAKKANAAAKKPAFAGPQPPQMPHAAGTRAA